ncbi:MULTISPECIES: hypothetical protein [Paraburkholderia]|uniref:Uncharacterized protein n=1 Tax=Paraburkholderia youngii TaxID=2782701 RepID=A0ABX2NYN6_9BURK|nr:hypothetical protein [Paraburkholderia youngii]NVI09653.1 hypothetical protein [Paraburkholderia youngii]
MNFFCENVLLAVLLLCVLCAGSAHADLSKTVWDSAGPDAVVTSKIFYIGAVTLQKANDLVSALDQRQSRAMRATENQWHKIAALMLMKLPGKKASITGGVMPAGGTSWNRGAVLDGNGRTCMASTTAEPCEGVRVAFYRATPTEAA